jgi:peptide chain release factor 1
MSNSGSNSSKKFDSVALYRIRRLLADLSNKTGRGTELVTLYLPPKKPVHEAIAALREESGTASNIKSDTTRAHVEDALTKTMQRLRLYKQTPENGLVIFCGAIPGPGGPGKETIELYEVLPNKPVTTYLYRCVTPDTKVQLQNGLFKTIDQLKPSWRDEVLKSTEERGRKISNARITQYFETRAGTRKVYRITSESGRTLSATEDHPILTPKGWKNIGEIRNGDLVLVYPSADLDEIPEAKGPNDDRVIADGNTIRNLQHAPSNIELTISRLVQRGLLPLTKRNPKLPLIGRILGHMFTDGSFAHNIENRNGKPYSHFTFDICLGDENSAEEIKADLNSLGAKVAKSFRSIHTLNVDGRPYTTNTIHIKFRDTAFCALLRALGAPVGSKVKNGTSIPAWLFGANATVRREFLAAVMGGDGELPHMWKSNPSSAIMITFHRASSLHEQSMKFASDLRTLFSEFGVVVNAITSEASYVRKDGIRTTRYGLRFKLAEENVLKLCHKIGYRYSENKASTASLVGEYLRIKRFCREKARARLHSAQQLFSEGKSVLEISSSMAMPITTVSSWARGSVSTAIIRSTTIPEYAKWLSFARAESDQLMVWESVVSIDTVDNQDVRDVTVESDDHSFFANGFVVHNCDDHFHLDPLRDMLREENIIGVLAMDSTEAGFGIVAGETWDVIDVTSSGVSGKTRKGGQSARRYERLREMELTDYYNRLADHAKKAFLESNHVKGLIVSGPGPTKDAFVKDGYLDYRLQNMVVGILDTGYSGREGVRETIEKAGKLLENVRVVEEKKLVQKFLSEVNSDSGLAIYGVQDILSNLKRAAVDTILVNDDTDMIVLRSTCQKCGNVREKFVYRSSIVAEKQNLLSSPCPKCSSLEMEMKESDIVDYMSEASIDSGAKVEVISSKTEDGAMLKSYGGVAALLRYRAS